jgi:peroxiredoxin
MKKFLTTLLPGLLLLMCSCQTPVTNKPAQQLQTESESTPKPDTPLQKNFTVNPEAILKDFMTWYSYTYYNIHLAQDFIGLDADSVTIHKTDFLTKLETGKYVPLKIKEQNNSPVYKLFRLQNPNQEIQSSIKQLAATEMGHFKMEGSELPDFDFTDLNGKKYNKANTKGNILLLKCWFINCVACVKEFPELNRLVDKYHGKNDLLFISLATDSKEKLVSFLSKKQFKYAVVPHEEEYMSEKLGIAAYPTHILVDRNGKIVKVTNTAEDIIPFLERQIGKQFFETAGNSNFKK